MNIKYAKIRIVSESLGIFFDVRKSCIFVGENRISRKIKMKLKIIILLIFVSFGIKAQQIYNSNPFEYFFEESAIILNQEIISKNKIKALIRITDIEKKDTIKTIIHFNKKGFPISFKEGKSNNTESFYYDAKDRLSLLCRYIDIDLERSIREISFTYDFSNRLIKQVESDFNLYKESKKKELLVYDSYIYDINYTDSNNFITIDFVHIDFYEKFSSNNKKIYFIKSIDSLLYPNRKIIRNPQGKIIEIYYYSYFSDNIGLTYDSCRSNQESIEKYFYDTENKLIRKDFINCKNKTYSTYFLYYPDGLLKNISKEGNKKYNEFIYEFFD